MGVVFSQSRISDVEYSQNDVSYRMIEYQDPRNDHFGDLDSVSRVPVADFAKPERNQAGSQKLWHRILCHRHPESFQCLIKIDFSERDFSLQ